MDANQAAVWVASIGGTVSLITLTITLIVKGRQERLHKQINSRMDELLELTRQKANAKGNEEGRADLIKEQKDGK